MWMLPTLPLMLSHGDSIRLWIFHDVELLKLILFEIIDRHISSMTENGLIPAFSIPSLGHTLCRHQSCSGV